MKWGNKAKGLKLKLAKILYKPTLWLLHEIGEEINFKKCPYCNQPFYKTIIERVYLDDPLIRPQTKTHHLNRYKFAISIRPPKGMALDVCCGSGYGTNMLQEAGYQSTGVDIDKSAIDYACKNYKNCFFLARDITTYPFDTKVDLITFFEAIEHITFEEGTNILKKIYRSLNPGGVAVISTPRDINGKYNHFHKSEWSYDTLKNIVGSIFSEIDIYGQDWDTGEISQDNVSQNDFYIVVAKK